MERIGPRANYSLKSGVESQITAVQFEVCGAGFLADQIVIDEDPHPAHEGLRIAADDSSLAVVSSAGGGWDR